MEPLPQQPIVVPQSRRFTRVFRADSSKQQKENDVVTIQIPPMKHTYLTKDVHVHFSTNLSYYQASHDAYQDICNFLYQYGYQYGWYSTESPEDEPIPPGFVAGIQHVKDFFDAPGSISMGYFFGSNELKKCLPTLGTCGPYGFFSDVEVYDYLGNTLLETIKAHDLWGSVMSDFKSFDDSLESVRPLITTPSRMGIPYETRYPAINYLDTSNNQWAFEEEMGNPPSVQIQIPPNNGAVPGWDWVVIPKFNCEPRDWTIDILTFLGKGSEKFAPLHNGFTVKFTVNRPNIPIVLANGLGQDSVYLDVGLPLVNQFFPLDATIDSFSVDNMYIRADCLEITPELDSQVDKVVHCTMQDYIQLTSRSTEFEVPFQKRSLKQLIAFERLVETLGSKNIPDFASYGMFRRYPDDSHEKLGFRVNNYVESSIVKYNGAKVVEYRNSNEVLKAWIEYLGADFYNCYRDINFNATIGILQNLNDGTRGLQALFYPRSEMESRFLRSGPTGLPFWSNDILTQQIVANIGLTGMGKFALVYDLQLPGYSTKNICGIDTSRATLTMHLQRNKTQFEPTYTNTDLFGFYDAFVHVDPGKSTSTSF